MIRLKSNRALVLERIASACRAAGREPGEVHLVAVTKSVSAPLAEELFRLGCGDLGESRADQLAEKHAHFTGRGLAPRWHFVGHLQRNKARRTLALADVIHSVDSLALWETLARLALELGRFPGIYLQVKLAEEPSKSGLAPRELPALLERARAGPLPLLGLMTLAPLVAEEHEESAEHDARRVALAVFQRAAELAASLPAEAFVHGAPRLSMGMSQDFEQAIAAGAHLVRIGGALFEGCAAARGGSER